LSFLNILSVIEMPKSIPNKTKYNQNIEIQSVILSYGKYINKKAYQNDRLFTKMINLLF